MVAHGQGASVWAERKTNKTKNVVKALCWECDQWQYASWKRKEGKDIFKPCNYLTIHDNQRAVNVSKMQSSLQNINKQSMEACCRQYAQAPVVVVYLLWTTFQKGHLTEPVPSRGLWLHRAWGHLPDPTPRKGGGKGRGGQRGGGGRSWGRRASREKGTVPLAIRAVPRALIKLGGVISIRKQGPVDS